MRSYTNIWMNLTDFATVSFPLPQQPFGLELIPALWVLILPLSKGQRMCCFKTVLTKPARVFTWVLGKGGKEYAEDCSCIWNYWTFLHLACWGFTRQLRSRKRNLNFVAWNILLLDMATLYQVISDILWVGKTRGWAGQLTEIANWPSAKRKYFFSNGTFLFKTFPNILRATRIFHLLVTVT